MKNVNVRFSEVVYDKTMPLCYVGKTPKINDNFNSELCNREIMRFVNENYKTNFGFLKHSKNDDSFLFSYFIDKDGKRVNNEMLENWRKGSQKLYLWSLQVWD